nr:hypothetical protein [Tanacetum cinerariifolium]
CESGAIAAPTKAIVAETSMTAFLAWNTSDMEASIGLREA